MELGQVKCSLLIDGSIFELPVSILVSTVDAVKSRLISNVGTAPGVPFIFRIGLASYTWIT